VKPGIVILIGQYDSPFVRRVAVALRHYELVYEHRPWSVWGDAERIAALNPLRRVPTLVLNDGTVLGESFVILDALDEMVEPERRLLPASGPLRREGLRVSALATGLADKGVSLLYESLFRKDASERWVNRCKSQINDTLGLLERERAERSSRYWLGDALSHADIALACALRFIREAHPDVYEPAAFPRLTQGAERCEALPEFRAVVQPITNNL
jgi:glutathione S-transferase